MLRAGKGRSDSTVYTGTEKDASTGSDAGRSITGSKYGRDATGSSTASSDAPALVSRSRPGTITTTGFATGYAYYATGIRCCWC